MWIAVSLIPQVIVGWWIFRRLERSLHQTRFEAEEAIQSLQDLLTDYMDEQREIQYQQEKELQAWKLEQTKNQ